MMDGSCGWVGEVVGIYIYIYIVVCGCVNLFGFFFLFEEGVFYIVGMVMKLKVV